MQPNRLIPCLLLLLASAGPALAQLEVSVAADDLAVTRYADGLNFPLGMAALDDGSLLVAVTNGSAFFSSTTGSILRLHDSDGDGMADVRTVIRDDVPAGRLSALRRAGDLVFVTGQGQPIVVYRLATAASGYTLTPIAQLVLEYPGGSHRHSALAVRPAPGDPTAVDLFFQIGAAENDVHTDRPVAFSSTIGPGATLASESIHMVRFTTTGSSVQSAAPVLIAIGLRNAAGMAIHPATGDLYIAENGIDGLTQETITESFSADELNVVPADDIGTNVLHFGFSDTYVEYRTGNVIGSGGVQPLIAFTPIPDPADGAESEGPNDLAIAPPEFPEVLRSGVFIGFHGQWASAGPENEENAVVYADPQTGTHVHFVATTVEGIGHPNGLVSTADELFVADMASAGALTSAGQSTGVIYRIHALDGDDGGGDVGVEDPSFVIALEGTSVNRKGAKTVRLAWDRTAVSARKLDPYYATDTRTFSGKAVPNKGSGDVKIDEPGAGPFRVWLCEEGTGSSGVCSNELTVTFESALAALGKAFPNPFNAETHVTLEVHEQAHVRVVVYDVLGREVAILVDGFLAPGSHQLHWNAAEASTGTYLMRVFVEGAPAGMAQQVNLMK